MSNKINASVQLTIAYVGISVDSDWREGIIHLFLFTTTVLKVLNFVIMFLRVLRDWRSQARELQQN